MTAIKQLLRNAVASATLNNKYKKFASVSVRRGNTVYPVTSKLQLQLGVRWVYDSQFKAEDGLVYNTFTMQPSGGKIPSPLKKWRDANGGAQAGMGHVRVRQDGSREEVLQALLEGIENTKN